VASHHSGLIDCILPKGDDGLTQRLAKDDRLSDCNAAWSRAEPPIRDALQSLFDGPEVAAELAVALERVRAVDNDDIRQPFKQGLLLRLLFSCLIDADRTNTADFVKPDGASFRQHGEYASWDQLIARLERKLEAMPNGGSVDQRRHEMSSQCLTRAGCPRGIFTLTVSTGGGKTLASLRSAFHHARRWGMDRVVYVSPYISIADQNAQLVREVLERLRLRFDRARTSLQSDTGQGELARFRVG
jgi:CRISPR-associated endonuclease/helicase Cas3